MKTSRDEKMADDEDDVLFQKVHNFIRGSGGFVELSGSFQVSCRAGEQKICAGIEAEVAEESD